MPEARPSPLSNASSDAGLTILLDRARQGESEAWGSLVGRLQGLVYSIPHRYRLDEDAAAEVFLTTFEALHRNLGRLADGRALSYWVARTATRSSLRLLGLQDRSRKAESGEEAIIQRNAAQAEDTHRVRNAMARMTPLCRDLLGTLRPESKESCAMVAVRADIPVSFAEAARARCLENLRRTLHSEGFFQTTVEG